MKRRHFLSALGAATLAGSAMPTLAQYLVPEGQVRLVFNENPYGPSPKALAEVRKILPLSAYYPDSPYDYPIRDDLFDVIAGNHGLDHENVFVSSGSNEGLQAALMAYGQRGKVMTPSLTYDAHLGYAEALGVSVMRVPLRSDLQVDLDAMEAQLDDSVAVVYLANPNNPTGLPIDAERLRAFCRSVGPKALVIIDEAYNELTDEPEKDTMVDLVREGHNVLVTRTFSKIFGMAGLRVGYGMARPDIIKKTSKHIMAWPNGVGLTAAYHSYIDSDFIRFSREKVLQGRAMVEKTCAQMGLTPVPSQTNFVFVDVGRDAMPVRRAMAKEGVLINAGYDGYPQHLRVSMGRLEDLKTFDRVFKRVMSGA